MIQKQAKTFFANGKPDIRNTEELFPIFKKYKNIVESAVEKYYQFGTDTKLKQACEYALTNGGKRIRPALVFMIANALPYNLDVTYGALAIEFFHTASLVADDLPCMDNDDERRNKPSVHKVYGEAMALLVSYGLIAAGYECIGLNAQLVSSTESSSHHNNLCTLALAYASRNTGLEGATGGQFLDIFPPDLSEKTLREILYKKTVSLFEISFVFGWIFGGGDISKLKLVEKAALHFGMAYQIADDIQDVIQDGDKCRESNFAVAFGIEYAISSFHEEIKQLRQVLQDLKLETNELLSLVSFLESQV